DRLVRVCLAKDPDDRLQTAHDVMQELKWIGEGEEVRRPQVIRGPALRERIIWSVGLVATAVAAWRAGSHRPAESKAPVQFEVRAAEGGELHPYLAVSPDGSHVAYMVEKRGEPSHLLVYSIEGGRSERIPAADGASGPSFWSPDGQSIGFYAGGSLRRVG